MKHYPALRVLLWAAIVVSAASCDQLPRDQATERKVNYELQERCAKRAEELYQGGVGYDAVQHRYHYNARLNKCFMWFDGSDGEHLLDVNENKYTRYLHNGRCNIEGKSEYTGTCTRDEWDAYLKRMMEE